MSADAPVIPQHLISQINMQIAQLESTTLAAALITASGALIRYNRLST
jgi:hypothetical protein